jgi:hypothetical protein
MLGPNLDQQQAARDDPQAGGAMPGVVGVMTSGRLAFSVTQHLLYMHCAELGIPVGFMFGGAWEQKVTQLAENAIAAGAKYILFFDGDGAWDIDDIRVLYRYITTEQIDGRPLDAVFPVQADRNGDAPLCFNWAAKNVFQQNYDYSPDLTRVLHGHFGLTFVRVEALQAITKPWFHGQPGEDGSWNKVPGKMDADTYFWLRFANADRVVGQANKVVLGHMELGIRWQRPDGVSAQSLTDFVSYGKPSDCRCPLVEEMSASRRRQLMGHLSAIYKELVRYIDDFTDDDREKLRDSIAGFTGIAFSEAPPPIATAEV